MKREISELTGTVPFYRLFDFQTDAFATLELELDGRYAENTEVIIGEKVRDGHIVHEPGYKTYRQQIFQLENGHHVYRFQIQTHIPAYQGFPHCLAPKEAGGEVVPFRYVEISRYYGQATVRRIAWFADWNDAASAFACDDPRLNRVWEFCKYTMKATSVFDRYVDGERERMPYEGDAYINQLGHFCQDTNYTLARATIAHFMENGKFTWPTEWLLLTPMIVRDYLYYSGDEASVKAWLPRLEEKLLPQFMNADGLLAPAQFQHFPETFLRGKNDEIIASKVRDIVDWPETERDGYEQKEVNLVPNAYLHEAFKAMYELTGDAKYLEKAAALRKAIRTHLMKDGQFIDSIGSSHIGIHTALFALLFGIAEPEEEKGLKDIILKRGMACSVYGAQYLLDVCYLKDMPGHGLDLMTSDSERSWLNMLREGATIAMESWGDKWKLNQDWNHAWGAAPANVITRRLCGIRPTAPGFASFVVEPQPGSLAWFRCVQPTIHGPIEVRWARADVLELIVPEQTEALYEGKTYKPGNYRIPLA